MGLFSKKKQVQQEQQQEPPKQDLLQQLEDQLGQYQFLINDKNQEMNQLLEKVRKGGSTNLTKAQKEQLVRQKQQIQQAIQTYQSSCTLIQQQVEGLRQVRDAQKITQLINQVKVEMGNVQQIMAEYQDALSTAQMNQQYIQQMNDMLFQAAQGDEVDDLEAEFAQLQQEAASQDINQIPELDDLEVELQAQEQRQQNTTQQNAEMIDLI